MHLQFVLQCTSNLYRSAFGALGKGKYFSTPPICIAARLPFISQYASHLCRNAFGKVLVVVVTGMFPNPPPRLKQMDVEYRSNNDNK